jgi:WD40 repeat protein
VFNPAGRVFLTASYDGTACIRDPSDGHPIGQPLKHLARIKTAEFSPEGDRVVTGSFDNTVRVWDALTGQPIGLPIGHSSGLASVAFNSDASRLVTVTTNGVVEIWNAHTGASELTSSTTIRGSADRRAVFSPDGSLVLVSHGYLFDARTAEFKRRMAQSGSGRENFSAEFSPNKQWLLTASQDFTARVWDWKTGRLESAPMRHDNFVLRASYSADGQNIVTASDDQTARVWDSQGQPRSEPLRHGTPVWDAQMNADGNRLVARLWTSNAWLWEIRKRPPPVPKFSHAGGLLSVRFQQGRSTIAHHRTRQHSAALGRSFGPPDFCAINSRRLGGSRGVQS